MDDKLILKLVEETATILAKMVFHEPSDKVGASYNSLLAAAKKNHPEDAFLTAMPEVDVATECNGHQLQILFTQLRIVLDALQQASPTTSRRGHKTGTTDGSA